MQAALDGESYRAVGEKLHYTYSGCAMRLSRLRAEYGVATTAALCVVLRERGLITADLKVLREPITLNRRL